MSAPHPNVDDANAQIIHLIEERTGLAAAASQLSRWHGAIAEVSHQHGHADLWETHRSLTSGKMESPLWQDLVVEVTVGETYFFRDDAQMMVLRQHILPDLIQRHAGDRRLRLWSAACASGEEPYSLALLLRQALPNIESWKIWILGTDINLQALQRAQEARFRQWSFRRVDSHIRERYFYFKDDQYELDPLIRQQVVFDYLNLWEKNYPSPTSNTQEMDLILFRNVSIYWDESTIRQVADRLTDCLSPGGWLIVGAAETNHQIYHRLEPHYLNGTVIYQRPANPGKKATRSPAPGQPTFATVGQSPVPSAPPGLSEPVQERATSIPDRLSDEDEIQRLYQVGMACLAGGQTELGRQQLAACIELAPTFGPAYYELAATYADTGQLSLAQEMAEKAASLNVQATDARYLLALIHQELNQPSQAVTQLRQVLYIDPTHILAHAHLSTLYGQLGQPQDARRHHLQALNMARTLTPDTLLPGSDSLTAGHLVRMLSQEN